MTNKREQLQATVRLGCITSKEITIPKVSLRNSEEYVPKFKQAIHDSRVCIVCMLIGQKNTISKSLQTDFAVKVNWSNSV